MTCNFTYFNSISVISGRWSDDDERLCAMELRLQLKRSSPQAGLELRTARSVGQRLTHWATRDSYRFRNALCLLYFGTVSTLLVQAYNVVVSFTFSYFLFPMCMMHVSELWHAKWLLSTCDHAVLALFSLCMGEVWLEPLMISTWMDIKES